MKYRVLPDDLLNVEYLSYHGLHTKDKTFNATLKTDFDESIRYIYIIPQDIGRVVLNLITNVFYAVGEKRNSNQQDMNQLFQKHKKVERQSCNYRW